GGARPARPARARAHAARRRGGDAVGPRAGQPPHPGARAGWRRLPWPPRPLFAPRWPPEAAAPLSGPRTWSSPDAGWRRRDAWATDGGAPPCQAGIPGARYAPPGPDSDVLPHPGSAP